MEALQATQNQIAGPAAITPDLFTEYLEYLDATARTTKDYIVNLRQFAVWMKYANVTQPTRADVISYRDWLTSEHEAITLQDSPKGWGYRLDKEGGHITVTLKATTVCAYMQSVKAFFSWTESRGIYPNITQRVRLPKIARTHKKDALRAADVVAIENSIKALAADKEAAAGNAKKDRAGRAARATEQGARDYAMFVLGVNAGLRTVEISRANVKDLETIGGQSYLYVWGKGHAEADTKVPISHTARSAIDDYLAIRASSTAGNTPLFVSTGNRSGGKRMQPKTISAIIKKAMKDAGYSSDRLTAHSMRHTTAAMALQATGNNIYEVQATLRHTTTVPSQQYLDELKAEQRAGIAENLDAMLEEERAKQRES